MFGACADGGLVDDREALERALAAVLEAGRAAWPAVRVDDETFVRHLARHHTSPAVAWLAQVRASDLYLACGCATGAVGAADAFEREYVPLVSAYLVRAGVPRQQLDDLRQRVREKLLVGARKIGDYSGRGTLAKWLEVVSARVAIDASRERRDPVVDDSQEIDGAVALSADPELDYIKERYRAQFKVALARAISALDSEQRNLLRLHFVDGVTLDQMSALFSVHRATIARRIAAARESILDAVKAELMRTLGASRDEVESLLRLARSRLDLSLSALLGRLG
jgi:RNA polymerase sigma-70 factor (ECF subfamily)